MKTFFFILLFGIIIYSCENDKNNSVNLKTWAEVSLPVKQNSMQPFLFSDEDTFLMSFTEKEGDSIAILKYTEFSDHKWQEPQEIARGNDWFVNWADFPAIAENRGLLLSHFLQKSDTATFAYDIRLKGFHKSWKDDFKLHSDTTKTEHGFVSLVPYNEASFLVIWLDGRKTLGGHDHAEGAMTLRVAEVMADGSKINEVELDAKTCDCCQTSTAISQNGPVIVYRDRSDNEIRDIYITRKIDGDWTIPKPVYDDNWQIAGCPVNGPKIAANKNNLSVAWFTNANGIPKVNVSFSKNNGKSFDKPFQVDNGNPIGRVDIAFLNDANVLVSWMESKEPEAELKVVLVNNKNGVLKETMVTEINASRSSGFPQLEIFGEYVYISWNDIESDNSSIKMNRIAKAFFLNEHSK